MSAILDAALDAERLGDIARNDAALARAEFLICGKRYSLQDMLVANAEDDEFCAWARGAVVGDRYAAMHAEPVRCVSGAVS